MHNMDFLIPLFFITSLVGGFAFGLYAGLTAGVAISHKLPWNRKLTALGAILVASGGILLLTLK